MKRPLRQAFQNVQDSMQPLLDEDFLRQPLDDAEANVLHRIRTHYLPDCLLAYNDALYFAGHAITRGNLVDCMSLAQVIATNKNLENAFKEAKRMRELMDALAWSAQGMIEASQLGKTKSGRTGGQGERAREEQLAIWNVKWEMPDDPDVAIKRP